MGLQNHYWCLFAKHLVVNKDKANLAVLGRHLLKFKCLRVDDNPDAYSKIICTFVYIIVDGFVMLPLRPMD